MEKQIKDNQSSHCSTIGLLKGGRFVYQGETHFRYIEIDNIVEKEQVDAIELKWEVSLDLQFKNLNELERREIIGWFISSPNEEIIDKKKFLKLIIKWLRLNLRDSLFVGILNFGKFIIKGEQVNVISYNREVEEMVFHRCDYIYSFSKDTP